MDRIAPGPEIMPKYNALYNNMHFFLLLPISSVHISWFIYVVHRMANYTWGNMQIYFDLDYRQVSDIRRTLVGN